jgi:hypothetical protein
LVAREAAEALQYLRDMPDAQRAAIGHRARSRTLAEHTAMHRASEFERYIAELEN